MAATDAFATSGDRFAPSATLLAMSIYALLLAAGRSDRFGGATPKQYLPLGGSMLLRHAVAVFASHPRVAAVLPVIRPEDRPLFDRAVAGLPVLPPVAGGRSRQESARLGLEALARRHPQRVLIHDSARPFPDAGLIDRVIDALDRAPAAVPCLALRDTVKRAAAGVIRETVERSELWRAQTPQGFRFGPILAAHRAALGRELTDDSAVAEAAGLGPLLVEGGEDNLKVTTPDDLAAAERILVARQGEVRVGQGFDVHAFAPGERLVICGIDIPHSAGLAGHSDADVGLHALTDALLGAIAAGDIGLHFSSSDPKWRGAASEQFVRHAARLVGARGGAVAHVDLTIICERPRIGPYRAVMIERVAAILGIGPDRVSVKATTTDRLGFTGRGEGIAAQAVATVRLPSG
jgi:2-C-methyl-D-erythritol 4-phosphate cytidylyltransferase / 2-C-methyl-D-erythritol 2,4-cyclodiphosphate synthase